MNGLRNLFGAGCSGMVGTCEVWLGETPKNFVSD